MNKISKILIGFIVLIVLLVSSLGIYTYFLHNKEKVLFDTKKLGNEVVSVIGNFPYELLINDTSKVSSDLTDGYRIYVARNLLDEEEYNTYKYDEIYQEGTTEVDKTTLPKKDSSGVKYPNYSNNIGKLIAQKIGLTVSEINKIDSTIFEETYYYKLDIINFDKIKQKIDEIFFKNSVIEFEKEQIIVDYGMIADIVYDKSINKILILYKIGGSEDTSKFVKVIDTKTTDNKFTFEIITGIVSIGKNNKKILTTKDNKTIETDEVNDKVLSKYKDKLDKYEIVFLKNNNIYKFDSIKELDA